MSCRPAPLRPGGERGLVSEPEIGDLDVEQILYDEPEPAHRADLGERHRVLLARAVDGGAMLGGEAHDDPRRLFGEQRALDRLLGL